MAEDLRLLSKDFDLKGNFLTVLGLQNLLNFEAVFGRHAGAFCPLFPASAGPGPRPELFCRCVPRWVPRAGRRRRRRPPGRCLCGACLFPGGSGRGGCLWGVQRLPRAVPCGFTGTNGQMTRRRIWWCQFGRQRVEWCSAMAPQTLRARRTKRRLGQCLGRLCAGCTRNF